MSIEMFAILLLALNTIGLLGTFTISDTIRHAPKNQFIDEIDIIKASSIIAIVLTVIELGLYALVKFTGILNFLS